MTSVSISAALGASFAFAGPAWGRAWGVLLVTVWLAAMIQGVALARPDLWPLNLFGDLVLLAATTAATGALFRIGVGPDHAGDPRFQLGPAGFNWGGLEWRVLGANVVVGVTFVVLAIFAIFIWAVVFGVSAATQGVSAEGLQAPAGSAAQMQAFLHIIAGPAGVVSIVVAIPLLVGLAFLWAKLSLFAVTAADTGGFNFGRAWSLTRGALRALIVSAIVIVIIQMVAGASAGFVAGVLAGLLGQGVDGGRLWGGVAGQAAGVSVNIPLFCGLQLFVYRSRRGEVSVAQTFA